MKRLGFIYCCALTIIITYCQVKLCNCNSLLCCLPIPFYRLSLILFIVAFYKDFRQLVLRLCVSSLRPALQRWIGAQRRSITHKQPRFFGPAQQTVRIVLGQHPGHYGHSACTSHRKNVLDFHRFQTCIRNHLIAQNKGLLQFRTNLLLKPVPFDVIRKHIKSYHDAFVIRLYNAQKMLDLSRCLCQLYPKRIILECIRGNFRHLLLQVTENQIIKQRTSAGGKTPRLTQQPIPILCALNQGCVKGSSAQIVNQNLFPFSDGLGRCIAAGCRYRFLQKLYLRQPCSCCCLLHQLLLLFGINCRHRKYRLFHRVALTIGFL